MKAILAINNRGCIGDNNKLLYHISEDLNWFKLHTENKTVVMGRKTFDSLNNIPLPNRFNLVITSNPKKYTDIPNKIKFVTLDYIKNLSKESTKDFWIIGGKNIYKQLSDNIEDWYITEIDSNKEGDCLLDKNIYIFNNSFNYPRNEYFIGNMMIFDKKEYNTLKINFYIYSNEKHSELIEQEKKLFKINIKKI